MLTSLSPTRVSNNIIYKISCLTLMNFLLELRLSICLHLRRGLANVLCESTYKILFVVIDGPTWEPGVARATPNFSSRSVNFL